jgi:hypothetical protein
MDFIINHVHSLKKKLADSAKQVIKGKSNTIHRHSVHPNQLEIDDPKSRKHYKQRHACHRDELFYYGLYFIMPFIVP